jgi:phosphatidylglycerol:prolipoprotein diacylglycerol transferase
MMEQIATEQIEALSPIAFHIGPFPVHWYGLLIGLGVFIALMLGIREGKKHGIHSDIFVDLVMYGVIAGILGGRIYYVIFEWESYRHNPGKIFAIWEGGLAIHGVLIASVITLLIFCRVKKLAFWRMADIVAPNIILAQAIGRWGNFMNQEAHGGPVTREFLESLRLPEFIINQMYIYNPNPGNGMAPGFYFHHPTFLYESIWNIIGFIILVNMRRLKLKVGEIFLSYLAWYSFGRFFIEGLRTDSLMITDTLRAAQVMSVVLIIGSIALIVYRRKAQETEPYDLSDQK